MISLTLILLVKLGELRRGLTLISEAEFGFEGLILVCNGLVRVFLKLCLGLLVFVSNVCKLFPKKIQFNLYNHIIIALERERYKID